jgi:ATP-dependent RNA helicase RhlB
MEFQSLILDECLKKALAEAGYVNTMPVQARVLEEGLDGRDLYVQSQTGTGKTAAYLIIIFQRLLTDPLLKGRKALIMVPTRELAVQVEEEARILGRYLSFKTGSFYGGVGYGDQQQSLRSGADILVGTPGRVLDLNASGQMNLMEIAFLILDEADRMFDMGFYPDLRKLIKVVPDAEKRQTMLFSATLNMYVKNLALEYTKTPVEIEIEAEHITVDEIDQRLYHVPSEKKFSLLLGLMEKIAPESAIIFCNTKRYTETVARRLRSNGIQCEFISGDLPQRKRLEIIEDLKAGRNRFLVATDVAARGLDIEALSLVVNYDLPNESENYVHRIGRTARAGAKGIAVSFASEQDVYELTGIERYISAKIPSFVASGDDYAEDRSGGSLPRQRGGRERRGGREERGGREYRGGREERGGREFRGGRERGAAYKKENRPRERGGREIGVENRAVEAHRAPSAPPEGKRVKLSQLSTEERMAYYKEKYGSSESEKPVSERGGAGENKKGRQKNRKGRGKDGKGGRKQAAPRVGGKGGEAARSPSSSEKGLVARIAAFFGKK